MTPKEKAHQLVQKYYVEVLYGSPADYSARMLRIFVIKAKNCALWLVDEVLDEIQPFELGYEYQAKIEFWNNVKKEIGAL
jgi:hypothetical protein